MVRPRFAPRKGGANALLGRPPPIGGPMRRSYINRGLAYRNAVRSYAVRAAAARRERIVRLAVLYRNRRYAKSPNRRYAQSKMTKFFKRR